MFGYMTDNSFTKLIIKWVLTGKKIYYEELKEWFHWRIKKQIPKEREQEEKEWNKTKIKISTRGYIYLIKSNNLYKIGRAKNLKSRIKTYQTENPFGIEVIFQKEVDDYIGTEKDLLTRFENKRERGEWFKLNNEDIQWIKENL